MRHTTHPINSLIYSLFRRNFSQTPKPHLRTTELTPTQLTNLKANPDRLWHDIHKTAQWGTGRRYGTRDEETGLSRLSLSDADKSARDWFIQTTESLSCKTSVDAVGNIFAVRPGFNQHGDTDGHAVPATFAGSHLDSQPTGGRFDGILGVCAGIEMLRVLEENWIETEGPVGVVNWTNEEGARFPKSMMGSGVWSGAMELRPIHELPEVSGSKATVKQELERIRYLGPQPASYKDGIRMGAHFELHIEQGPHLEKADEAVGVVEGVQAYEWFTLTFTGRDCHTGTTDFASRADALYAAGRVLVEVRDIAERVGGLASVGIINAYPGSVNTVPGLVRMSLDVRHPDDGKLELLIERIKNFIKEVESTSEEKGGPSVAVEMVSDFKSKAVRFDAKAVECIRQSAGAVLSKSAGEIRGMTSGAGHDSVFASMHCPTAMIFSRCREGISHHPSEWCGKSDCAAGASVLIQSLLRFDKLRHENGDFL